ncbi:MAG: OmpH family outer membrane protein [Crocinitomicaceae bacterium]
MKNFLLAIALVLGAGSVMAQSKVAHVNSQTLLDTLPSRKVAILKLQEFETNGVKELQEMEADFNAAVAKYQASAADMSPVIIKIEEEKLMKKQQALQEREQSLNTEMQAYSQELNTPILGMVQKAVKIVSERLKINYVIDESVTLYFAGGLDITDEVIVELLKMDKK